MGEGWVPGFAGKNIELRRKTMGATLAWFGPRLCRKGRFATLRAWAQTTNIGCQALVFLGAGCWLASWVPRRPRGFAPEAGGINTGAVVGLRPTRKLIGVPRLATLAQFHQVTVVPPPQ